MSAPLVECRDITKIFPRKRGSSLTAVKNIDLKIDKGTFTIIVGRSGAGKTTLLNLVSGLERPTSGTVNFEGRPMGDMGNRELSMIRLKRIGFVFQSYNFLTAYTVSENIKMALAPAPLTKEKIHKRVGEVLRKVGLSEKADYLPLELSAGQQQRAGIARALANEPVLVFADEPTAALDPVASKEIVEELLKMNEERNVTLVVSTCGIFPLENATRVIYMKDGMIVSKEGAGY